MAPDVSWLQGQGAADDGFTPRPVVRPRAGPALPVGDRVLEPLVDLVLYREDGEGVTISYGFHPSPFGLALVMTTDVEFAGAVAHRSLALQPATGALAPWKKTRGWFR